MFFATRLQGFNENASVLGMLCAYAMLSSLGLPTVKVMWGFGLCIALAMAGLIWRERSNAAGLAARSP